MMPSLEVVFEQGTVDVPMMNSPEELISGLETIVRPGINDYFDDVVWLYYMGLFEKVLIESDPGFRAFLKFLEEPPHVEREGRDRSHLDVLAFTDDLARNIALLEETGSGFIRIETLDEQRYIAAPAHHIPHVFGEQTDVDIDITHAVTFDGSTLTNALFNAGSAVETIDYRDEPAFPAYREHTIGQFFIQAVLEG